MRRRYDPSCPDIKLPATALRATLPLLLLCALSACGGSRVRPVVGGTLSAYAPPGPADDPWGLYIGQASRRFNVPSGWIRAVMRQESGGHEYLHGQPITSDAGAAGLMQLMPPTYAELAGRFGLGADPYEPHDNIIAGTGYIRDLYDRYGSPAFLAAYDAGPHRLDSYLAGHGALPHETVDYLAAVAPIVARDRPLSGPLAAYADGGASPPPVSRAYARARSVQCWQDPDAAYNPTAPCRSAPVRLAGAQPAFAPQRVAQTYARETSAQCWRDPDAAYDPTAPCRPAPVEVAMARPIPALPRPQPDPAYATTGRAITAQCWRDPDAAYDPTVPCRAAPVRVERAYPQPSFPPAFLLQPTQAQAPVRTYVQPQAYTSVQPQIRSRLALAISSNTTNSWTADNGATGRWAIQVGAFVDPDQARRTAESVRSLAPRQLGGARAVLGATTPFGGHVVYRARLLGLSAGNAASACGILSAQSQSCVTVPPGS